jgi:hypothetical protein
MNVRFLTMDNKSDLEIDEKTAQRIMKRIIILEKTNLKTKKYNDVEMVKKIKSIIEEEVECY